MASLTELRSRRDNLESAIQSGVSSITVDGQTTTFASMKDMRAVLADLNQTITALQSGSQSRPRVSSFKMTGGV